MAKLRLFRRLGRNWGGIKGWAKEAETRRTRRMLNGGGRVRRWLGVRPQGESGGEEKS